jgi:putative FmdB family regulatory protein
MGKSGAVAAPPSTLAGPLHARGCRRLPIYEYKCPHCGHQFEVMHAVNAKPPKCERCGRDVRRVFSPVGIIFKGTGWHITDYRKTPAPSDGEGKKTDSSSSEKTSGAGGKAKTDGKTEGGSRSSASNGKSSGGGAGGKSASRSGGGTTA